MKRTLWRVGVILGVLLTSFSGATYVYADLRENLLSLRVSQLIVGTPPLRLQELVKPSKRFPTDGLVAAGSLLQNMEGATRSHRHLTTLAAIQILKGDQTSAQATLAQADRLSLALLLGAYLAAQRGDRIAVIDKLTSLGYDGTGSLVLNGIVEAEKGDLATAYQLVNLAEGINRLKGLTPNETFTAYGILSNGAIMLLGDHDQAVAWALKRAAVLPDSAEPYYQLASLYTLWKMNPNAARDALNEIKIRQQRPDYRYYYYTGVLNQSEGRLDEALSSLQTAAAMNPNDMHVVWFQADTLFRVGRWIDAEPLLRRIVARFTDRPDLQERARDMLNKIGVQQ